MESSFRSETLRARLAKVLPSLLRLVSLVLLSLPNSRQVREAGAVFVEAHHKALLRILRGSRKPSHRVRIYICILIQIKSFTPFSVCSEHSEALNRKS